MSKRSAFPRALDGEFRPRRERKSVETRERIFHAALELFAERGVRNVTIEEITRRADVGKGTFFNHFPHKEAVLTYLSGRQVERIEDAFHHGEITGTPDERAIRILLVMAENPIFTPALVRSLFASILSADRPSDTNQSQLQQIEALIADEVRDGQRTGVFAADLDPDQAGKFLLGQYYLALLVWGSERVQGPLPQVVRQYAELALRGLAAR